MKGLYLASPHGKLIADGKKLAIVRPAKDIDENEYIIISKENGQGLAFGVARLLEAEKVNAKEFDERFEEHKVSVAERSRWWAEKEDLYIYKIDEFQPFDEAKKVQIVPGTKMMVGEVEIGEKNPGGPGSGNFGHTGRPGQVGGSQAGAGLNKVGPVDINSSEFKNWFGDSVILDEDGKPLKVYHGTSNVFDYFDMAKIEKSDVVGDLGRGVYFDSSFNRAAGEGRHVKTAFLSLEDPLDLSLVARRDVNRLLEADGKKRTPQEIDDLLTELSNVPFNDPANAITVLRKFFVGDPWGNIVPIIHKAGYDGVIAPFIKEYMTFDASKIWVIDEVDTGKEIVNPRQVSFGIPEKQLTLLGDLSETEQVKIVDNDIANSKNIRLEKPILNLSIADTKEKSFQGFQSRESIALNEGMLFPLFPNDETISIWMKDTLVPLTVAFLDSDCKILALEKLEPMSEKKVSGPEGTEWALEATPEWFESFGVTVGNQLVMGYGGVKEVLSITKDDFVRNHNAENELLQNERLNSLDKKALYITIDENGKAGLDIEANSWEEAESKLANGKVIGKLVYEEEVEIGEKNPGGPGSGHFGHGGRLGQVGGSSAAGTVGLDQTKTANFKKWFGNSTAVDRDGNPKVFYRGASGERIEQYDADPSEEKPLNMFFVTPKRKLAEQYARQFPDGKVYELYVKTEKTIDISTEEGNTIWQRFIRETNAPSFASSGTDEGRAVSWTYERPFREWLDNNNIPYDGIYIGENDRSRSLAVLNVRQAKSISNIGRFDPANPDVTKMLSENDISLFVSNRLFGNISCDKKGGPGSGNFGHSGRPGQVGGSSSDREGFASSSGETKIRTVERDISEKAKVDITENSIRVRVIDPSKFQKESFRTITIDKDRGVQAVVARPKGKTTTKIQTFIFDKTKWEPEKAQEWVEERTESKELVVLQETKEGVWYGIPLD